ncbi:MAG: TetR/AcrR family transcriptional regulator [Halanaerobiales bacterium]
MERKMEKTQKRIIEAAISLFDEFGIDETTMEQISETADVARGTLYNYFSSKEAIISEYIEQSMKENKPIRFKDLQQLPDTRARIEYIFEQLISGIQNRKELFERFLVFRMQQMLSFEQNESEKGDFSQLGYKIIELGQKSGEIRTDIPLYILEDLFEFAFAEAIKPLYIEPGNYNQSESINRCIDFFMNGVRSEKID